jgi:ribosome-associated heat shock protein Hsp15
MAEASIRLDKWLWHARAVRTRTLAQKLVAAGHVRINRDKTHDPARHVRHGDVLTIALDRRVLVWRVAAIGERRGGFAEAQALYEVVEPPSAGDPGH